MVHAATIFNFFPLPVHFDQGLNVLICMARSAAILAAFLLLELLRVYTDTGIRQVQIASSAIMKYVVMIVTDTRYHTFICRHVVAGT